MDSEKEMGMLVVVLAVFLASAAFFIAIGQLPAEIETRFGQRAGNTTAFLLIVVGIVLAQLSLSRYQHAKRSKSYLKILFSFYFASAFSWAAILSGAAHLGRLLLPWLQLIID